MRRGWWSWYVSRNTYYMNKKYRILIFFPIAVVVFFVLEVVGQAMGLISRRTLASNLLETLVVGVVATLFFVLWARRRRAG